MNNQWKCFIFILPMDERGFLIISAFFRWKIFFIRFIYPNFVGWKGMDIYHE